MLINVNRDMLIPSQTCNQTISESGFLSSFVSKRNPVMVNAVSKMGESGTVICVYVCPQMEEQKCPWILWIP